jgi:hypothetical protein
MATLYERIKTVQTTNPYFSKDLKKAEKANKFIGRGSAASSTNKYMIAAGELANCGFYTNEDIVFVSSEGMRKGRLEPNFDELSKAVLAKVTFVMDDEYNRNRPYNLGERQVAEFLQKSGYIDIGKGIWKPNF